MYTYEIDFYNKLTQAVKILDELDDMGNECPKKQSEIDSEISDWLHKIQHDELTEKDYVEIGKKLKELRKERESLNNQWELARIYNTDRNRLADPGNREFLMNSIRNKYNNFNKPYNNRVLDEEKIKEVLGTSRKKRTKVDHEKITKMFNDGMSVKDISKELGCAEITIYKHLKKGDE